MNNHYAQIDAGGVCVAQLASSNTTAAANMVPIAAGENRIGQRWTGAAWVAVPKSQSELAREELAQIDRDTGMQRTMREVLIAIADKVGADAAFLKGKEAAAVIARNKI